MGSKRVIIVHPEVSAGGRLASRLYRTGHFSVDTAQDGFEAAAKLFTNRYDCLILHTRTPGLQPLRVINVIRGASGMERMPVLVVCAGADPATHQTLKSLVDTHVLIEPVDPRDLADTVIRLTRGPAVVETQRVENSVSRQDSSEEVTPGLSAQGAPGSQRPAAQDIFAHWVTDPPQPLPAAKTPGTSPAPAAGPVTHLARAAGPDTPRVPTDGPETTPSSVVDPENALAAAVGLPTTPAAADDPAATPATAPAPGPARAPGTSEPPGPEGSGDDTVGDMSWHKPAGPVGRQSTAVGMGLTDLIWYRAERGDPVPGLPPGVSRLDDLISGRLGDVLSKDLLGIDQSLAIAVLRQSNSAEFSGMEKLAGLDQAMLRVGQRSLARHMMATWEARSKTPRAVRDFLLGDYWRHCLTVACIAEEVAAHLRYRSGDAVFSAGLLHDVGKLFFVTHFHEGYERVEAMAAAALETPDGLQDISKYERELLKVDHGLIGFELCQAWLLPPVVQAGTLHHHLNTDRVRRLPDSLVTMIVALADLIERTLCRLQEEKYAAGHGGDPTLIDLDAHMEAAAQEVLQGFYKSIHDAVPFWVHQFLRGKHLPLRLVYDSALRRVKRATRRAELQAYCPRWAGGSLEQRKTG